MVADFVRGVHCLEALLLQSVHARGVELAVPYAQLAEFKAAAKRRARCVGYVASGCSALQASAGLERWLHRSGMGGAW